MALGLVIQAVSSGDIAVCLFCRQSKFSRTMLDNVAKLSAIEKKVSCNRNKGCPSASASGAYLATLICISSSASKSKREGRLWVVMEGCWLGLIKKNALTSMR